VPGFSGGTAARTPLALVGALGLINPKGPNIATPVDLMADRISLRPYRDEYAPLLYAAVIESRTSLARWMPWCHSGYSLEDSAAWVRTLPARWESGLEYTFAIFDRAGDFVGGCGLNALNRVHNFANLGYWVRESRQRQGIAVDAVHALARFGFRSLCLTRIEIVAAAENLPSRRVAEKAGATYECLARNRLLISAHLHAAAVYSLIPDGA
jgi:ribosomal-protein-serine acetyltransferase